jgi:1-pyrroline-5-carboxylate dehydrogenase
MKMGSPEDMSNFITAVISEGSFDKLAKADQAKKDTDAEVIMGGNYDKSKGTLLNQQLS